MLAIFQGERFVLRKEGALQVEFVEQMPSTQEFLVDAVREGMIMPPFAIAANRQSAGIGSRQRLAERKRQSRIFVLCRAERSARGRAASVGEHIFCDDHAGISRITRFAALA